MQSLIIYEESFIELFYNALNTHLPEFKLSPLRYIPPKIKFHKNGLEIYSGITDNAPAQCNFRFFCLILALCNLFLLNAYVYMLIYI